MFFSGNADDSVDLYLEKQSTVEGVTNECNKNNTESNMDCARNETTAFEKDVNQNFVGVAYDYGTFPKILAVHSIKPDEMKLMQKAPQTMPPQLPLSPRSKLTGDVQPQVEPPQLSPPEFHPRQGPPHLLQRQCDPPQLSPPHFTQSQYPLDIDPQMNSPPQFRQQQAMHAQYRQMMLIEEAKRMEIRRRQATLQQLQATLEHNRFSPQQQRSMTVVNTVPDEAAARQMHGLPFSRQRNCSQEGLSNGHLSPHSREQRSLHQRVWQSHPNGYPMPTVSANFDNRQVDNVLHSNLPVKRRFVGFSPNNDHGSSHLSSPKRGRFANGVFNERPTTPVDFPLTQISSPGHRYPQFIPRNDMYHERMTGIESPYLYQSSVPPLLNFEDVLREQSVQQKVLEEYQNRIRHGRRLPQHEYDNYTRLLKKQQQRQQQPVLSDQMGGSIAVNSPSRIPGHVQEWIHGTRPEGLPGTVPNRFPQDITNRIPAHPEQINPRSTSNGRSGNIPERILDDAPDRNSRFIPGWIPGNRQSRPPEINADGLQERMQNLIQDRIPENAAVQYLMNEPKSMPMNSFMDDASVERLIHQGNHQVKDAVEHYNRSNRGTFSRQKSSDSYDKCSDSVNNDICAQKKAVEDAVQHNDRGGPPLKNCQLEEHNDSRNNLTNESIFSMNSKKTMSFEFRISTSDLSRLLLIENKRELLRTLKAAAKISQRILAIVVERLLEKRVLANALILLDHLKLSDLTEIIKERVLSVVREIVWGDPPRLDLWREKKKDQSYNELTEFHHDSHVMQISDNEVDDNETIENEDRGNEVNENDVKENDVAENLVNGNEISKKDVTGNDAMTAARTAYENRKELSDNVITLQSSNQKFQSFKDDVTKQVEVSSVTKRISAVVSKVTMSNAERHTGTPNDVSYEECCDMKTEIVNEGAREMHSETVDEASVNIKQEPSQRKEYNDCCYGKETDTARNRDVENSGYGEQMAMKRNKCGIHMNTNRVETERVVKEQGETERVAVTEMLNGCKDIGSEDYVTVKLEPIHDITANVNSFNNSSRLENTFDWTTFTVKQEQEVDGNVKGVAPDQKDDRVTESQTGSLRKNTAIEEFVKEMDRHSSSFDSLKNNNSLLESELETLGNVTIYWDALGNIDIKEEDGASRKDNFKLDCKRKIDENCFIREEITEKDCKQDYESSAVGNVFDLFR